MTSNMFLQSEDIVNIINLVIIAFSLLLFALAIKAYLTTRLGKIAYAAIAFALFAIQLFIEYADDTFGFLGDVNTDIVNSFIILCILILFFVAIVKRR
ncbi:MAG: hypothetical protein ACREAK_12165 [Nitrosarchaeum sp.]